MEYGRFQVWKQGKEWKILRMEWNAIFHILHTWISLTE